MLVVLCPKQTFTFYTIRLQQGEPRQNSFDEALKVAPNAENVFWVSNKTKFQIKGKNFRWAFLGMLDRGRKKGVQKQGLPRYDADYTVICFEEASDFTPDQLHMVKQAVRLNDRTLIVGLANPYFPQSAFFLEMYRHFPPPVKLLENESIGRAYQIKDRVLCQWTNIFAIKNAQEPYFSKADYRELLNGLVDAPLTGKTSLYGIPMALKGALYPDPILKRIKYFTNPWTVFSVASIDSEFLGGLDYGFTNSPSAFIFGVKDMLHKRVAVLGAFKTSSVAAGEFDTIRFCNEVYAFINLHVLPYLHRFKKTMTVWTDSHSLALTSTLNHHRPDMMVNYVEFRPVSQKLRAPLSIILRIEKVFNAMAGWKIAFKSKAPGLEQLKQEWATSYWKEQDAVENVNKLLRIAPYGDHLQDAYDYAFVDGQD